MILSTIIISIQYRYSCSVDLKLETSDSIAMTFYYLSSITIVHISSVWIDQATTWNQL